MWELAMTGSLHFWLRCCLAALPFIPLVWYFALKRKKSSTKTGEKKPSIAPTGTSPEASILWLVAVCMASSLAVGMGCGWLLHDVSDYHNSFVLTNAVIEGQNGPYVTYHFESDASRRPRTIKFCDDYQPEFQRGQVIAEMVYTRKTDCESIAGSAYSLTLRRVNGVPVIKE